MFSYTSMNVFGYNPKVGSKCACIVDATVAYDKSKMVQVFIFLIHQAIEMKGIDHLHEWCSY